MKNLLIPAILVLTAIIGIAARIIQLDRLPPYLSNDEISIAYDSYSLVHTGRDEHRVAFPVSFISHGSYKAPMYAYLLALPTLIFGNSSAVARIPSLVCGLLTSVVGFLIAYRLTGRRLIAAVFSAVLLISPWHIYTSRMVLESNVALLFLSLGVLYILRDSLLAAVFLSLSMYAYHTQWGLAPLLVVYFFTKRLRTDRIRAVSFLILFLFLITPLFSDYLSHLGTSARANVEVIWNDSTAKNPASLISVFISNYLSYTNPGYLFFSGLGLFPDPHPYQVGLFVWPLIIPAFLGLVYLKKYILPGSLSFFVFWLLVSPVVPALTHGGPSLIRNLPSLLPYGLVISLGVFHIIRSGFWRPLVFSLLIFTVTLFSLLIYVFHFPVETASTYQGYRPVITYLKSHTGQFSRVIIDNRYGIDNELVGVPHLYLGYYLPLSPEVVQNRRETSFGTYYGIFLVGPVRWNDLVPDPGTWYITGVGNRPPANMMSQFKLVAGFPDASGRSSFEIWETEKSRF